MTNDLAGRLRQARGVNTRDKCAELLGVHPNTLKKYEDGERVPDAAFIVKAAEVYGLNAGWLLTGLGVQRHGDGLADGYVLVPIWDVEASSGHGMIVGHEEIGREYPVPFSLLRKVSVATDRLCAVFNRGNSNAPDLNDGDILIVDRSVERIIDDAYYLFQDDGALLVKMIERAIGGKVILKSRNPNYEARELPRDEAERLQVFGRVRWRIGAI